MALIFRVKKGIRGDEKILKWVLISGVVLVVIAAIIGRNESKDISLSDSTNIASSSTKAKGNSSKLTVSPKEEQVLELLLREDYLNSLRGEGSISKANYVQVKAGELQKAYKANEAKGDQTYKGKKLIIHGRVESINSGIGDVPYVALQGNMFSRVQVHFARDYRDTAVALNKGDTIAFACLGNGVLIGSPMLKECKPISAVANELMLKDKKNIAKALVGDTTVSEDLRMVVLMVKVFGKVSNDFSGCEKLDEKCVEGILGMESFKDEVNKNRTELLDVAKILNLDATELLGSGSAQGTVK